MMSLRHQQVALGVLLLPEQGARDLAGGVVHSADQREVWASALKPVVPAAVHL